MVRRKSCSKVILIFFVLSLFLPLFFNSDVAAAGTKQNIYDYADLLADEEVAELEDMANTYGAKRETSFMILTTNDTGGKDIVDYAEDFYDKEAPGYDKPHGNTVILTIDMKNRDVYLAGFYKAEEYLDNSRLDLIREKITPDLTDGNYYDAFHTFIETSSKYMGIRPGANPDNPLFNLWFQLLISIGVAGIVVGVMLYSSGGKITVNDRTYMDADNSQVLDRRDAYLRTTVTKQRKPSNNNNNGGGGGGGVSRGGHSHSGSRGSF
jgi:uncharacterized protein